MDQRKIKTKLEIFMMSSCGLIENESINILEREEINKTVIKRSIKMMQKGVVAHSAFILDLMLNLILEPSLERRVAELPRLDLLAEAGKGPESYRKQKVTNEMRVERLLRRIRGEDDRRDEDEAEEQEDEAESQHDDGDESTS